MTLILSLLLAVFQSSDSLKQYIRDGNSFLDGKQYQQALDQYKEAFRLKPEADRVKMEGTFFEDYLPRYKIALCYEHIDIIQAEEWVAKSREALEENVIRRKRKSLAEYHSDLERIGNAAEKYRKDQAAKYQLALNEANRLLGEYRFEQARKAFEALVTMDPSRPEGQVGVQQVASEKAGYIRSLELDVRSALLENKFQSAEQAVTRIVDVDPKNPIINSLRAGIADARKAKVAAEATAVAKSEPETKPVVTEKKTEPEKKAEPRPVRSEPSVVRNNPPPKKIDKEAIRTELLATLEPYRRGSPEDALARLEAIDEEGANEFASYQWLCGVYLLSIHHSQLEPDTALLDKAGKAMDKVATLQPDFDPDADLYPDFVIAFYAKRR